MREINLYDYQDQLYQLIIKKLFEENYKSVCGVLPTGGGKSVVIGKLANDLPGRSLVLTHRREILEQNAEWIDNCGLLASDIDTLRYDNKVVIAMVQTLHSRIKKYGIDYVGKIDNIILDEIHILIFEKVFKQYNYKRLIGLTATPVTNKKITTNIDGVEYTEPFTLSRIFDCIVEGPDTQDLIKKGKLVQEFNVALQLPDFDNLKESDNSPDGYTKKSLNEVYSNTASLNVLWEGYEKYGKGKKTIIFNATTEINEIVLNFFRSKDINCMMFDSVNTAEINPDTSKKYKRKEVVKWFKNQKDAVLINTNVFTTGFDDKEIECVILNRATKSLSLYLQMAGRGSRITTKIYKDHFVLLDLGQNIYNHGPWSQRRKWEPLFWPHSRKLKKTIDLLDTWECSSCESLNFKGIEECQFCGAPKLDVVVNGKPKKLKEGEFIVLSEKPKPKADSIINYTKALNEDSTFAFNLLEKKIIQLFIDYKVSKEIYINRKDDFVDSNGVPKNGFHSRVKQIYMPIYFAIIKSDLPGKHKKLETGISNLINKIEKIYK